MIDAPRFHFCVFQLSEGGFSLAIQHGRDIRGIAPVSLEEFAEGFHGFWVLVEEPEDEAE